MKLTLLCGSLLLLFVISTAEESVEEKSNGKVEEFHYNTNENRAKKSLGEGLFKRNPSPLKRNLGKSGLRQGKTLTFEDYFDPTSISFGVSHCKSSF